MTSAEAAEHNRARPLSYTDEQRMIHVEYVARMQRRSMPPRCNPFAILLLVMSVGMMFIGVTMTIIAHWPGATQIGENPLKIAGPILFGVGGVLTIFCVFLVYCLNQRERHSWDEKLRGMVNKTISSSPRHSQLSADVRPGTASTGPMSYSNYDDDPRKSHASERGVDLLPDPFKSSKSDADVDAGASVPVPLRVTKKRRPTKPSADVSGSDVSGSGDLAPGMTSTLRQDGSTWDPPVYSNLSYEADTPEGRKREKQQQRGSESGKRRRRQGGGAGGTEPSDPIRDPVMRNMAAQQQLRVHIKAQPGTAVHITPSATPPGHDQAPAYHHARPGQQPRHQDAMAFPSGGESETEI